MTTDGALGSSSLRWPSLRWPAHRWRVGLILVVALAGATGACGGEPSKGPRGAPVLLKLFWRTATERAVVWSRATDANLRPSVGPMAVEFALTFDGRLDGNKIEDTVRVDGGVTTRPKEMPPVAVTWPGLAALAPGAFKLAVGYNSLPLSGAGSGTSYVFGHGAPTYPSATTISVHLDAAGLTSVYDEPMVGPAVIDVRTEPFLARLVPPTPCPGGQPRPVDTNFQLPIAFNNMPWADAATVAGFVHVATADTPLPFRLVPDPRNAAALVVVPGTAAGVEGRWPAGSRVDVTVAPGLPDLYGVGLDASATGSFVTLGPGDDGANRCPAAPDGGALDAGDAPGADGPDGGTADAAEAGDPDGADATNDLAGETAIDAPDGSDDTPTTADAAVE